jgi:hypothetical protein
VSPHDTEAQIRAIFMREATTLRAQFMKRIYDFESDPTEHIALYQALGVDEQMAKKIDLYQSLGRLLYPRLGRVMEDSARLCLGDRSSKIKIVNPNGRPKLFELDCVVGDRAYEIKWRDATTDGDHVSKEEARVRATKAAGFKPVRLTFFSPRSELSRKVQMRLGQVYKSLDAEFLVGPEAFEHLRDRSGIDLRSMFGPLKIPITNGEVAQPGQSNEFIPRRSRVRIPLSLPLSNFGIPLGIGSVRCSKHDWSWLYNQPTDIEGALTSKLQDLDRYTVCTKCGAIGYKGLRRIRFIHSSFQAEYAEKAKAWNAKYPPA